MIYKLQRVSTAAGLIGLHSIIGSCHDVEEVRVRDSVISVCDCEFLDGYSLLPLSSVHKVFQLLESAFWNTDTGYSDLVTSHKDVLKIPLVCV